MISEDENEVARVEAMYENKLEAYRDGYTDAIQDVLNTCVLDEIDHERLEGILES